MPKHPWEYDPVNPPRLKTVKVCCISDTHEEAQNIKGGIPECDILIHAGDITYLGDPVKLSKFGLWGASLPLPTERKICVAGNHDRSFQLAPELARACIPEWTYLEDTSVEVMGLKIWGSPWSPDFYPEEWVFNHPRGEAAAAHWSAIPDDTDIVVVHGPPYGYGDRVRGVHVGCVDLTKRLMEVKPRLTVCGHIHEDRGIFSTPWGTVVNASIMTGGYKSKNKPFVITLTDVFFED